MPCNCRRVSMPGDAALVYKYLDDHRTIQGGTGQDLAQQIIEVVTQTLDLTLPELTFLRGDAAQQWQTIIIELVEINIFYFSRTW